MQLDQAQTMTRLIAGMWGIRIVPLPSEGEYAVIARDDYYWVMCTQAGQARPDLITEDRYQALRQTAIKV